MTIKTEDSNSPPKAAIYTRFGDQGKTMLVDGQKVEKFNLRVNTYGDIDELNSLIGIAVCHNSASEISEKLLRIQNELFDLGSRVACANTKMRENLPSLSLDQVETLEKEIDIWNQQLPKLNNFILPGGHPSAAFLHACRSVCRRAERLCSQLNSLESFHDTELIYLNRLSDWLFMAARRACQLNNVGEILWKPKSSGQSKNK